VRHTSVRVILSLIACEDYKFEQLDVKTTFFHCNLEETIYMRQMLGFEEGTRTSNGFNHKNVRYHFIKEIMKYEEIEVAKILGTEDNATHAFTKVVRGPKFKYCMEILGVEAN
ncbi:retrovirus-related pol polyprotein from transposon TNT 1-94, partial [Tanacetum coccineum]